MRKWEDYEVDRMEKAADDDVQSEASYHSHKSGASKSHKLAAGLATQGSAYAASAYGGGSISAHQLPVTGGGPGSVYMAAAPAQMSMYGGSVIMPMAPGMSVNGGGGSIYGAPSAPIAYSVGHHHPGSVASAGWAPSLAANGATGMVSPLPQTIAAPIRGQQPTDAQLLAQIQSFLATADLMTVTRKSVREELARVFGVDLSARKEFIHSSIDKVLKNEI